MNYINKWTAYKAVRNAATIEEAEDAILAIPTAKAFGLGPLAAYLGTVAPAPEDAPMRWRERMPENIKEWERVLEDAWARGSFAVPVDIGGDEGEEEL